MCLGQLLHSPFINGELQENYPRRSVQVRAFVFFENDERGIEYVGLKV